MLPKKEVLSLFRTGSDPLLASSSLKNAVFCLIMSLGFSGPIIILEKKTKNDCNPRQLNLQRKQGDNV